MESTTSGVGASIIILGNVMSRDHPGVNRDTRVLRACHPDPGQVACPYSRASIGS